MDMGWRGRLTLSVWLVLAFAVVFVGIVFVLMRSSSHLRHEERLRVQVISAVIHMDKRLHEAEEIAEQMFIQPTAKARSRWRRSQAAYVRDCVALAQLLREMGRPDDAMWHKRVPGQLAEIARGWSHSNTQHLYGPHSFRVQFRELYAEHKGLVRKLRRELGGLSRRLATMWRYMSFIALIACGLAMLIVVLFFRDQRFRREAEQLKDDFVSNVSHELRTPLTAFRGAISLLKLLKQGSDPQESKLLDIAERNAIHLGALIDDLLDIQKLQSGKLILQPVPCELNDLLQQCIQSNEPFADDNDVRIQLESEAPEVLMRLDPMRFRQIIDNLLSNAIKFSPPGETVIVRLLQGAETITIEVIDRGPGISKGELEELFHRFVQANPSPTSGKQKGTGLGLSICKMLVECMDGELGVRSTLGEGSLFYVRLNSPAREN